MPSRREDRSPCLVLTGRLRSSVNDLLGGSMGPVGIRAHASGRGRRGGADDLSDGAWRIAVDEKVSRPGLGSGSAYAVVSVMLTSSYTSIEHKGGVSDICRPQEGRLQTRARAGKLKKSRRGRRPVQRMPGLRPPTYGKCPDRRNFRRPRARIPHPRRQAGGESPARVVGRKGEFREFPKFPTIFRSPSRISDEARCATMRHFRAMRALRPTPCAGALFRHPYPSTAGFARFK